MHHQPKVATCLTHPCPLYTLIREVTVTDLFQVQRDDAFRRNLNPKAGIGLSCPHVGPAAVHREPSRLEDRMT